MSSIEHSIPRGDIVQVEHGSLVANFVLIKGSNVCPFGNDVQATIKDNGGTSLFVTELLHDTVGKYFPVFAKIGYCLSGIILGGNTMLYIAPRDK